MSDLMESSKQIMSDKILAAAHNLKNKIKKPDLTETGF